MHASTSTANRIELPDWTDRSRYASLRSFRGDGTGVDTPVWFALDDDGRILFRTPTDSAKLRRIRSDPRVELRPCDWRGRVRPGAVLTAIAEELPRGDAIAAEPALKQRYGWQWNIVPLIPVPGVTQADRDLDLRSRRSMARASTLWETSSIVALRVRDRSANRGMPST